ncbi:30S ribosomal protein S20 [uncultured Ruminococcus sp.]|uniref:Small ribosomal subunit protein bS20 n=1 Tax=Massiliimalia timonensis TaxID=1987501 RepID=A0A8J6PB65_9FIRM|nr:30S ribosomal protein S20 [Massiliimalia timonensis]MBC8610777.1 30S ribosomal protein S20 [Massiliimalia timonensis]SCH96292.1 30S ribosomal protein S20 [uncultured Clostridium sp.]SCI29289.1 30S ribosomal protein S20 [uncultured Ruminococcus sp.]
MPNIKSAKKRVLVTKTKAARNKALKSNLKTVVKTANAAIDTNAENKVEAVTAAIKRIDQACAKGLMHKNCAARKKSQLAVKLNKSNA